MYVYISLFIDTEYTFVLVELYGIGLSETPNELKEISGKTNNPFELDKSN